MRASRPWPPGDAKIERSHDRNEPIPAIRSRVTDATGAAADEQPVWHLTIAYDGTDFHGWQVQPDRRTVQGELRRRLRLLFRDPELRLEGTSRTDAGVHALDQHVSFSAASTAAGMDAGELRRVLNRWLPPDIRVLEAERREPGFSARFDNYGKAYTYCVCIGEKPHPLFSRFLWHVPRPVDLEAIRTACAHLCGRHDFRSFAANAKREIENYERQVLRFEVFRVEDQLCFNVVGESFLYKMVRALVGYVLHVGLGRGAPEDALRVLAARDRCAAADSAPPQGLFLARVFFAPEAWRSYRPLLPPFAWSSGAGIAGAPGSR